MNYNYDLIQILLIILNTSYISYIKNIDIIAFNYYYSKNKLHTNKYKFMIFDYIMKFSYIFINLIPIIKYNISILLIYFIKKFQ